MDFWQTGFWASAFWSPGFWGETTPDVAPVRLGRRPTINRPRDNDEALLMLMGML